MRRVSYPVIRRRLRYGLPLAVFLLVLPGNPRAALALFVALSLYTYLITRNPPESAR